MSKREYTHVRLLYPEIKAKIEAGKTRREIAEYYGFKDKCVVKELLKRDRHFVYAHKARHPVSFKEANEMIDRYIHFYNHERIQTKTGVAPLTLRHSA